VYQLSVLLKNWRPFFAHHSRFTRGSPIFPVCKNVPLLLWGPLFVGPLFGRTCWTCLNPPLRSRDNQRLNWCAVRLDETAADRQWWCRVTGICRTGNDGQHRRTGKWQTGIWRIGKWRIAPIRCHGADVRRDVPRQTIPDASCSDRKRSVADDQRLRLRRAITNITMYRSKLHVSSHIPVLFPKYIFA